MKEFRFSKLSAQHKKWFIIYQLVLIITIAVMTYIAVAVTNPVIIETEQKMNITIGAMVGITVFILAFFNRIRNWLKIKSVAFLITWVLLLSLEGIMDTLLWAVGLNLIPLMIDDIIVLPFWRNLWYNIYE